MSSPYSTRLIAPFLLLISLVGCESDLDPQDPKLIFADREALPETLDRIANPLPGREQKKTRKIPEKIRNQIIAKSMRGRLSVAVIDEGVDFMHRNLIRQTRFTARDGNIVGAGFDALGGDFNAHSNLIRPQLFALTAKSVENGRLVGQAGDPIRWTNQVQGHFQAAVLRKMAAHPDLRSSFLTRKFSENYFPFFAISFVTFKNKWNLELRKKFGKNSEKDLLIDYAAAKPEVLYKDFGKFSIDAFLDKDWLPNGLKGYPDALESKLFVQYRFAEQFVQVLEDAFQETEAKFGVHAALERFNQFENVLFSRVGTKKAEDRVAELIHVWIYSLNPLSNSPILDFINSLCNQLPDATRDRLRLADGALTPAKRGEVVRASLEDHIKKVHELAALYKKNVSLNSNEIRRMDKKLKSSGMFLKMFDELMTQRPELAEYLTCEDNLILEAKSNRALQKFVSLRNHPYLSSDSNQASHGTHVSGIIVHQDPKIDIVPVRVITQSVAPLPTAMAKLRPAFEREFANWLSIPGVSEKIGQSPFAQGIFGKPLSKTDLEVGMRSYLDETFDQNLIEYSFFDQIKRAIAYVGQEKIKIANISLGTNFTKAVLSPDQKDQEEVIENFYRFLTYEFFKYDVADAIQKNAAGTLFVIAAGNDGAWLDGKSRSGLPCDLSSPLLAGIPGLANNQIGNILCVGSVDDTNWLSGFTNIPISSALPLVLSRGEAVLSLIKTTDCSGIREDIENEFGKNESLPMDWNLTGTQTAFDGFLMSTGYWRQDPFNPDRDEENARAASAFNLLSSTIASDLPGALSQHRCMKARDRNKVRMSGTSMATPSISGYLAHRILEKAGPQREDADLYLDPQFAPRLLIQQLLAEGRELGGNTRIKDVKVIDAIKKWER